MPTVDIAQLHKDAKYWFAQENYEKALQIRLIMEQHFRENGETNSSSYAITLQKIANCYFGIGDSALSLSYLEQALVIQQNLDPQVSLDIADIYSDMGLSYIIAGKLDLALVYLQQCLSIRQEHLSPTDELIWNIQQNMAVGYMRLQQHAKAAELLEQILTHADDSYGNIPYLHNNLGLSYNHQQQHEKAIVHHTACLNLCIQHYGQHNANVALSWKHIATSEAYLLQYDKAFEHFNRALGILCNDFVVEDIYAVPSLKDILHGITLVETLLSRAECFAAYYHQQGNIINLQAALSNYTCSVSAIDYLRDSLTSEESKQLLGNVYYQSYEKGIGTALALWTVEQTATTIPNLKNKTSMPPSPPEHLQQAFYFSEKSKAMVLLQQRRSIEARMAAVLLPSDLRQKEEQLHEQLHLLGHQLQQEELKPPKNRNAAQITEWQGQHAACLRGLTDLQAHLRSNYYHYWYFRYNLSVATLADLQSALHKDTALISYFVGENSIYYFVVTKTSVHVDSLPKPADLSGLVKQYMDNLAESYTASLRHYIRSARACYQTVVEPVLACIKSRRGLKRLVIIPDGALYGMSFGALLTKDTQSSSAHQLPYLERRYQIDYHYSATLWLDSLRSQSSNKPTLQDFIGYAPVYLDKDNTPPLDSQRSVRYGDNHYASLPYSQIEVEACSHAFEVRNKRHSVYLHEKATLNNFKQTASDANYLLIAGHTTEDDLDNAEKIGIVLSPESKNDTEASLLTLADIYTLPLSSRLVVLSCCNTGVGSTLSGEGAMAINRGFLYAGVRGVVYTLFRVRDRASSELSPQLFEHFLKMSENDAAKALHLAKLDLIGRNSQPLAWAGFAFMGH